MEKEKLRKEDEECRMTVEGSKPTGKFCRMVKGIVFLSLSPNTL